MGKEHEAVDGDDDDDGDEPVDQQTAKELYANYKAPVIDPDAPLFGDDYGQNDDDDDESDAYVPAESEDDEDGGYGATELSP